MTGIVTPQSIQVVVFRAVGVGVMVGGGGPCGGAGKAFLALALFRVRGPGSGTRLTTLGLETDFYPALAEVMQRGYRGLIVGRIPSPAAGPAGQFVVVRK